MGKRSLVFLLLMSMVMFTGCSMAQESAPKKAPDFSLPDVEGRTVRLSDYNGKVVMLNFFAAWCPPCGAEIPDFVEMINTRDSEKFMIIGISVERGGAAALKKFAAEKKINYPVLMDDGIVSGAYGPIYSIPTTFIIDKEGNITQKIIGSRAKKDFEKIIEPLL